MQNYLHICKKSCNFALDLWRKELRHGLIFIEGNGHIYDVTGQMIK